MNNQHIVSKSFYDLLKMRMSKQSLELNNHNSVIPSKEIENVNNAVIDSDDLKATYHNDSQTNYMPVMNDDPRILSGQMNSPTSEGYILDRLAEAGLEQHNKNQALRKEVDRQTVADLVKKSNRIIISISSKIFPWDFFPNTIIVEESKVIFIFRQLFSSQSHAVDIKDISNVFIESSLFSSRLQIVSRTYIQNDITIGNLNRKKANQVRRIIEGLRTFAEHNIDTSNYEIKELVDKLEELHINR